MKSSVWFQLWNLLKQALALAYGHHFAYILDVLENNVLISAWGIWSFIRPLVSKSWITPALRGGDISLTGTFLEKAAGSDWMLGYCSAWNLNVPNWTFHMSPTLLPSNDSCNNLSHLRKWLHSTVLFKSPKIILNCSVSNTLSDTHAWVTSVQPSSALPPTAHHIPSLSCHDVFAYRIQITADWVSLLSRFPLMYFLNRKILRERERERAYLDVSDCIRTFLNTLAQPPMSLGVDTQVSLTDSRPHMTWSPHHLCLVPPSSDFHFSGLLLLLE